MNLHDLAKAFPPPPAVSIAGAMSLPSFSSRPLSPVEQYREKWKRSACRDMARAVMAGEDIDDAAERISRRWHRALSAKQLQEAAVWLALRLDSGRAKRESHALRIAQARAVLYGEPAVAYVAGIGLGMPSDECAQQPPFRWINADAHDGLGNYRPIRWGFDAAQPASAGRQYGDDKPGVSTNSGSR